MRVDVVDAAADLPALLARVEAGEDVEITRDGSAVARLVPIAKHEQPGEWFLDGWGSHRGQVVFGDDFEFTDDELDGLFHGRDGSPNART